MPGFFVWPAFLVGLVELNINCKLILVSSLDHYRFKKIYFNVKERLSQVLHKLLLQVNPTSGLSVFVIYFKCHNHLNKFSTTLHIHASVILYTSFCFSYFFIEVYLFKLVQNTNHSL